MTLIDTADTSAPRSYTLRGVALLATAAMVGAVSLLAIPGSAQAATEAASRPSVVVPAVAAGKLAPQGCTASGTTDTCDLYAMQGTTSMLGTPINIWGFSGTGVAGSATAPGPLLVVNQGDTVSVTLHNQIAGQQISLAFPGQPTTAFTAGSLSAVAQEAGIGSTDPAKTYTFTASRAGTFIYEAGHTANGTRQVAMGLAGALVVRSSDGSAYGPPAAGYPTTAYNDDAVVVLSEIDPAFNACPISCLAYPLGFDMRSFAPKYRLINGKPFPSTDLINTDQGHTVLLRYANVGSESHSMSLLGDDQTQVAQDGHAMKYAEVEVAMAVEPGATADTLVTMPSGPEAKVALYESAGRLDNNAQTATDPLTLAFGGMLTFLDTAFVDTNTADSVGPVSSHVVASPNPSNGLAPVTVTADLSDATTGNSNVTQAEIVIDDASPTGLGVGLGIPMTVGTFGAVDVLGAAGTISTAVLDGLPAGKHTVFVRAEDAAGNWGVAGSVIFNLPKTGPQTTNGSADPNPANGSSAVAISATGDDSAAGGKIDGAEYFLDTVGADGSGTPIAPNRLASVVSLNPVIPAGTVLALTEDVHHVFVHSHDDLGLWGPTLDIPLSVDKTGPGVDGADVSPSATNGILTSIAHPGFLWVSATMTDPNTSGSASPLADAEFFLDAIGAPGTGAQLAPVDGSMDSSTESVAGGIPISQVKSLSNGTHHVSVRGLDAAGNWGPTYTMELIVDKVAPVIGTVVGAPSPTNGATNLTLTASVSKTTIAVAEFWLGTTDPGVGKGTSVPLSIVGGDVVATVPLAGIAPGAQRFNLRVKDTAGNWSNAVSTTVTVSKPNGIFSNGFTSTVSPFGWSAVTAGPSITAAAGIPAGGGNLGMQVARNNNNNGRYVTDNSPTAETTYLASFAFNANTLTSGTNASSVLTLFEGRTNNAQVFAVQFHRTGGVNQIRMVMQRNGGAFTSAYVNPPAGNNTIRVDWIAGTAGSLRLTLNGTSVAYATGNTGNRTVETARLGLTAGLTNSMVGTAYFDSFVSTRNTLP